MARASSHSGCNKQQSDLHLVIILMTTIESSSTIKENSTNFFVNQRTKTRPALMLCVTYVNAPKMQKKIKNSFNDVSIEN